MLRSSMRRFAVLLVVGLTAVTGSSCASDDSANVAGLITTAFEDARGKADTTVDLGTLDLPPWKRVFVFGPYTNRATVDAAVGRPLASKITDSTLGEEGLCTLAFIQRRGEGFVTAIRRRVDMCPTSSAPSPSSAKGGIARGDAVFTVDSAGVVSLHG